MVNKPKSRGANPGGEGSKKRAAVSTDRERASKVEGDRLSEQHTLLAGHPCSASAKH